MINIYATLVNIGDKGVLIRGKSGSGKSDLALRLIYEKNAKLVADDRVNVENIDGVLIGSSPVEIFGKLEIRNLGIAILDDAINKSSINLIVDLVENRNELERLPEIEFEEILDVKIPKIKLYAFDCSTTYKIIQKICGKFI